MKKRIYLSFLPILLIVTLISNQKWNSYFVKEKGVLSKIKKNDACRVDSLVDYKFLNDRLWHYYDQSYKNGVGVLKSIKHIKENQRKGRLNKIVTSENYVVDTMTYSYPFLLPKAIKLLDTLAVHFRTKLVNTNFENTRFYVTSAVRTIHSVKLLRRKNRNASKYSAHLHGTAFDIGYDEFLVKKELKNCELDHLKDLLAKTLIEFKRKERCWVTFEKNQKCFHVVVK